jgi:hypothetical protein
MFHQTFFSCIMLMTTVYLPSFEIQYFLSKHHQDLLQALLWLKTNITVFVGKLQQWLLSGRGDSLGSNNSLCWLHPIIRKTNNKKGSKELLWVTCSTAIWFCISFPVLSYYYWREQGLVVWFLLTKVSIKRSKYQYLPSNKQIFHVLDICSP